MIKLDSCIVSAVKTLSDKSLRLQLDLPELSPEQMTDIFMAFKMCDSGIEIKDINVPEDKSPSKRLRDRLFVYYKHIKNSTTGFETWYVETMDSIGQKFLDKIN